MCAAVGASGQVRSSVRVPAADSVLLSERTDGNYIVSRYVLKGRSSVDYTLHYRINLAKLNPSLGNNSEELDELNAFVERLIRDTLMRVEAVRIEGYASPDGVPASNRSLAERRAQDFKNYVDRNFGFSRKFNVRTSGAVTPWSELRSAVRNSSIPEREAVLTAIESGRSETAIEASLKRMPKPVWSYMAEHLLPPLRRVVVTIDYASGSIAEVRRRIACPEPAPQLAPKPAVCEGYVVVDDAITGMIVELPDGDECGCDSMRARSEYRRADAADADRIARQDARAARKIAKKEAKAARKAERAAQKVDRELGRL
jgi:hypothetical protein